MAGFKQFNSRRKSFFAEQRDSNANPNFINTMDPMTIRSSVRRIIRDVCDDIILDEDYMYFKSNNIINACIQESYDNYIVNQTIRHALESYRTIILPRGMVSPDVDIKQDYFIAAEQLAKVTDRENIWATAFKIFSDIRNGADPKACLFFLTRYPNNKIRSL